MTKKDRKEQKSPKKCCFLYKIHSFSHIFFLSLLLKKPETEFTKQGYLFLMEKSKLSK